MSANDPFLAPCRSAEGCDLYWIRQSILTALNQAMKCFAGTILDVGSGTMPYRSHILQHSGVTRYIGLDLPRGKYAEQVVPDLAWDGIRIPLSEAAVECAMATEVLEHCPDPGPVLEEIRRVLKPAGAFFFSVPFLWPLHDMPYDAYRYTPFSLLRLLEGAGFCDIEINATGGWDASLAQMLGLWLRRNPMSESERVTFTRALYPLYEMLLRREERTTQLTLADMAKNSVMITGMCGMAFKAPGKASQADQAR